MQGDTGSLQDLKRYHLEHHNVPKTIYEEGNPPGISENANGKVQGSLLSGIDNKTVRRWGIEKRIVVQGASNSVRPQPGFGIGNRNQDQVSVLVFFKNALTKFLF